ncbi:MAG: M23 family metallopeptidase [Candidatus Nealsonbacteria bacterium]|nr:M23 family metallopeptidase [Candidatus Nealsonbacteria bacterium]
MHRKLKKAPFLGVIALIAIILGVGMFYVSFSKSFKKDKGLVSGFDNRLFLEKSTKTIESPNLSLVQENSIFGVSCSQIISSKALGVLVGEESTEDKKEITEYIVQSGDTIGSIAEDFNITVNTILWANGLNKSSTLKSGQKLIILPVSGIFHNVKKGDTIDQIIKTYKGNKEEIIAFNELTPEGEIYVGDILIIPNGTKPAPVSIPKPIQSASPLAASYFIPPILSPYRITQGLHWFNAVDFAYHSESCGKPVLAAAEGTILKIKYGYNGGAGNYIKIIHPNGLITHYGHLQVILVKQGDKVSQGDIIGSIGYSGKTIPAGPGGCHLHFGLDSEVGISPSNPFTK